MTTSPEALDALIAEISNELNGAPGSPDNRRHMLRRARDLLTALRTARIDALEEAAAFADNYEPYAAHDLAAAIRALKQPSEVVK